MFASAQFREKKIHQLLFHCVSFSRCLQPGAASRGVGLRPLEEMLCSTSHWNGDIPLLRAGLLPVIVIELDCSWVLL